jgi:hypothetical protein
LVVFYLLHLSGITVYFSLPVDEQARDRKAAGKKSVKQRTEGEHAEDSLRIKMLHLCSIIQSYTIFAFAFAMLGTAVTFGSYPGCNPNAVVVLFRPFSALKAGRILFLIMTGLGSIVYTAILVKDHMPPKEKLIQMLTIRFKKRRPATDQEATTETPQDDVPASETALPNTHEMPSTAVPPAQHQYRPRKPMEKHVSG